MIRLWHLIEPTLARLCQCAVKGADLQWVRNPPGKQHKVALVAVMRRLAGLLDTLLREDRTWQPEPPSRELEAAA